MLRTLRQDLVLELKRSQERAEKLEKENKEREQWTETVQTWRESVQKEKQSLRKEAECLEKTLEQEKEKNRELDLRVQTLTANAEKLEQSLEEASNLANLHTELEHFRLAEVAKGNLPPAPMPEPIAKKDSIHEVSAESKENSGEKLDMNWIRDQFQHLQKQIDVLISVKPQYGMRGDLVQEQISKASSAVNNDTSKAEGPTNVEKDPRGRTGETHCGKPDQPRNSTGEALGGKPRELGSIRPKDEQQNPSEQNLLPEAREADVCVLNSFPAAKQWRKWRMHFKKTVASCSGWRPQEAFQWIAKCEKVQNSEELEDNEGFDSLSATVSTGLDMILVGDVRSQVRLLEEEAALQNKMINGRQKYFLMLQHFRITPAERYF